MWIMIAGPHRSGSSDPVHWAENRALLHRAALALWRMGHVPLIGVDVALPLIEAADGDGYDEIMGPLSLALTARCDAVLRIGGESRGADAEVARFRSRALPVYVSLGEVPMPGPGSATETPWP